MLELGVVSKGLMVLPLVIFFSEPKFLMKSTPNCKGLFEPEGDGLPMGTSCTELPSAELNLLKLVVLLLSREDSVGSIESKTGSTTCSRVRAGKGEGAPLVSSSSRVKVKSGLLNWLMVFGVSAVQRRA